MTTKQNPVVKVGDKLIIRNFGMGAGDSVEKVTKVTPSGLIKTANRTLGPDLRIRGLPRWSGVDHQAELATPERLVEITRKVVEDNCRFKLSRFDWHNASSKIITKMHSTLIELLKEEKEAKDAEESK